MTQPPLSKRLHAVRREFRGLWWMAVRRKGTNPGGSRLSYAAMYLRGLRCAVFTAGEHSWGPLRYEYEGARWRKRKCRWCRAKLLPAEEMDANPPTPEERAKWSEHMATSPPTDEDLRRATEMARERGIYRDGRFVWE